jgi:hypothetical protein
VTACEDGRGNACDDDGEPSLPHPTPHAARTPLASANHRLISNAPLPGIVESPPAPSFTMGTVVIVGQRSAVYRRISTRR